MKFTSTAILMLLSGAVWVPSSARLSLSSELRQYYGQEDDDIQVARIALGFRYTCAIDVHTKLKCWGNNSSGEIGDGTRTNRNTPTMISLGDDDTQAKEIALGFHHSCAITNSEDGNNVMCWGRNWVGQVGDGTNERRLTPTAVLFGDDGGFATQISSGRAHTCIINKLNELKCWGRNWEGQLGIGTHESKNTPTTVSLGNGITTTTYATQIALGFLHSCAIDNLNNLLCWGDNTFGELGDGTNELKTTPTVISLGQDDTYATHLASSRYISCVIDNTKNLKCWGPLTFGPLEQVNTPTIIPFGDDGTYPIKIAMGWWHACAIDNLNNLKCLGSNGVGQLGDGTYEDKHTPTIIHLKNTTKMSLGEAHSCAISELSGLMCWGDNYEGQLGDGTNTVKNTPTSISISFAQNFFAGGYIE